MATIAKRADMRSRQDEASRGPGSCRNEWKSERIAKESAHGSSNEIAADEIGDGKGNHEMKAEIGGEGSKNTSRNAGRNGMWRSCQAKNPLRDIFSGPHPAPPRPKEYP